MTKSILSRIINEFIGALNKNDKLPRYVLIMLDKDFIEFLSMDDFGIGQLLYDMVNWLAKNIESTLDLRKEDIKAKNPGALWSASEPCLIWVPMLVRPILEGAYKPHVFAQCKKFNEIIDEIAGNYKHSHVMPVVLPEDANLYDRSGNLSPNGKIILYREINMTMRAFDRSKIDLKPAQRKFKPAPSFNVSKKGNYGQGDAQHTYKLTKGNSSSSYSRYHYHNPKC